MALKLHSFSVPLNLGPPRRCGAKDVKGCSCSGSAPSATISHALVIGMSGSLATLNGSPSAARAVTLTMLRLTVCLLSSAVDLCMVWGVRRRVGPVRQICCKSMRCLPTVRRAALLSTHGAREAASPEPPGFLANRTLYWN